MTRWEYARLESTDRGVNVVFTHRQPWTGLAADAFFDTLRRLGDEGWELVSALPLTAAATSDGGSLPEQPERPERPERPGAPGPREPYDRRERAETRRMQVQVGTDRWLLFKRPQPEPDPAQSSDSGAEMLKGLVGRHVLKGRLPLP